MLLLQHQKPIASSPARYKVIRGGRRGGKTTLEIETLAFKAMSKKGRRVYYLAPTQKQAREIIWELLKSRLANVGKPNEQLLEMRVPTTEGGSSLIKIAGWENRENFRGQPADHITFDETDTMRDFMLGWQEIFRPSLLDTRGTVDFIGTPKKENPNLRRLEKLASGDREWDIFHFTSWDNEKIDRAELEKAKNELDVSTYQQEIMAEYVENEGALFRFSSLVDLFSNSVVKASDDKYLIVDVADDGSDKTIFNFWNSLESYRIEQFERLNTEGIINQIREYAAQERIPHSHIAVDGIGVGAGVASSPLLDGIVNFKSSFGAIRTDEDITRLPNVHYFKDAPLVSEFRNLRSQCIFSLAHKVNNHELACSVKDVRIKEEIIEELSHYQDASQGDGKRQATAKEDIKEIIGRSPDISDTFIMRMYFEVKEKMLPDSGEEGQALARKITEQFEKNFNRRELNNTR